MKFQTPALAAIVDELADEQIAARHPRHITVEMATPLVAADPQAFVEYMASELKTRRLHAVLGDVIDRLTDDECRDALGSLVINHDRKLMDLLRAAFAKCIADEVAFAANQAVDEVIDAEPVCDPLRRDRQALAREVNAEVAALRMGGAL